MGSMRNQSFSIEPVTDASDVPTLASVFDEALRPDTFHQVVSLYSTHSVYESAVTDATNALTDPNQYVFKAIVEEPDEHGVVQKKIVGLSQWFVGYISIPKVDPFEAKTTPVTDSAAESSVVPVATPQELAGRQKFNDMWRDGYNMYIESIRGKKHIYLRKVAVHPAYQGRGIATALVKWGAEFADREVIAGWLNARPAGLRIYQKLGWRAVGERGLDLPGLVFEPVVSMLRPRPEKQSRVVSED